MPRFFRRRRGPYCAAVVAAAGSSSRMGQDKLTADLAGEPVLLRTLEALEQSPYIQDIIVVTRQELLVWVGGLCRDRGLEKVSAVLLGGKDRLGSVYRGVNQVSSQADLIAVHDGARPLVSQELIARVVEAARKTGAAAPALPLRDTVKRVVEDRAAETVDRAALRRVQTPQVFDADLLRAALHRGVTEGWEITDDCAAVERLGIQPVLVPGEEENLKLTTPTDLVVVRALWKEGRR